MQHATPLRAERSSIRWEDQAMGGRVGGATPRMRSASSRAGNGAANVDSGWARVASGAMNAAALLAHNNTQSLAQAWSGQHGQCES